MALRAGGWRLRALVACGLLACGALGGCGGLAFRVVQRVPPRVSLADASTLWIATDVTDPLALRVAERMSRSLSAEISTRVVPVGRPAEMGVVVLTVAIRRSLSHRPATVMQSEWTCDPTGACFSRQVPRMLDVPVVRLLVRVSVHDASGRVLDPARVIDVSETGEDEMGAELRLVGRVQRDIESTFRTIDEERVLGLETLDHADAQRALESALASPTTDGCEAVARFADPRSDHGARARVLHASGQCHVAVALARRDEVDIESLLRAESLLLAAVRAVPAERYARDLAEVRLLLARVRPRERETVIEGEPEIPPAYR